MVEHIRKIALAALVAFATLGTTGAAHAVDFVPDDPSVMHTTYPYKVCLQVDRWNPENKFHFEHGNYTFHPIGLPQPKVPRYYIVQYQRPSDPYPRVFGFHCTRKGTS